MTDFSPALNPEYRSNMQYLRHLENTYCALVEEYEMLDNTVRHNLETEYMMKIGRKEYRLFELQIGCGRLRREISLYRAAVNRNEKIDFAEVKKIIAGEFAEFKAQLENKRRQLAAAEKYSLLPGLGKADSAELKRIYRSLAKRLHPDLHPDLPPRAACIWEQATAAYRNGDLSRLMLLEDMAEELLSGRPAHAPAPDDMRKRIQELEQKCDKLSAAMERLQKEKPFVWRELLADSRKVQRRRAELDKLISVCLENKTMLEEMRDQLKTEAGNAG